MHYARLLQSARDPAAVTTADDPRLLNPRGRLRWRLRWRTLSHSGQPHQSLYQPPQSVVQTANGAWLLSRLGETESLRCLSASSLRCLSASSAGLEGRRAASPRQLQISYSVTGIAATHQSHTSHRLPRKSLGCVCSQTHPVHVRHRAACACH